MSRNTAFAVRAGLVAICVALAPAGAMAQDEGARETNCTDGKDDDGDTVLDCGDADCAADPACQADGAPEVTNARCSDWIDNDRDGYVDCDDTDCDSPQITACQGSWSEKPAAAAGDGTGGSAQGALPDDDLPALGPGMSVEDLIGKYGDKDGERNDVLCADGLDNDGDGRIDCADFGCRFDRTVTVCQGDPDFRFSIVARAEVGNEFEEDRADARFSTLQLRVFGPMPQLQDSFYLLSIRAERTPRLTFAMFQLPIGKKGMYVNVNSGGGGLSSALVRSAYKQLLLEPPFYVYNAFEQGNGGAVELGGPLSNNGKFLWRAFAAAGSGLFNGNVGGVFVADDNTNFTYGVGAQIHMNLVGFYNRWDSPLLYTPSATTVALSLGVKFDQRTQERYPAVNAALVLRHGRFIALAENYTKREIEFGSWQSAYNIQVGALVIPKRLLLAADFGEFLATEFDNPPDDLELELRRQRQETQWRVAAHLYLWRNIFLASVLYADRQIDPRPGDTEDERERELKLIGQYRF